MAEGAPPGAPQFSGTDDDPQHFTHQPPPVDGINFGSQPAAIDHTGSTRINELQPPIQLRRRSESDGSERLHRARLSVDADHHRDHNTTPLASPDLPSPGADQEFHFPPNPVSSSSLPRTPATPATPRRARFPSDAGKLARRYSAPKRPRTDTGLDGTKDETDPAEAEKGADSPDQEVPNDAVHRGWWASFRRALHNLVDELGKHEKPNDLNNLMADIGLDIGVIEQIQGKTGKTGKKKGHNRISSIVGAATMLARPGMSARAGSTASVATIHSGSTTGNTTGNTTAVTSGTTTPNTLKKIFGSGINARDLRRQLQEWKKRAERNPEDAELIQAKADLAHRRSLVMLLVRS